MTERIRAGYRATGTPTATSNDTLTVLAEAELRTYISEPDRGERNWKDKVEARQGCTVTGGGFVASTEKNCYRRRGELLERGFAHAYETGDMRRVHLRGRENIVKRVLIHVGGFN